MSTSGQVQLKGQIGVKPGDQIPAITLPSTAGRKVNLATEATNKHIVLFFYPGDGEGERYSELSGCTSEGRSFRDHLDEFRAPETEVFGVSLQTTERQKQFAEREHLNFELLSDSSKELVQALRIPLWISNAGEEFVSRNTIVVEKGGRVAYVFENVKKEGHVEAVLDVIRRLS